MCPIFAQWIPHVGWLTVASSGYAPPASWMSPACHWLSFRASRCNRAKSKAQILHIQQSDAPTRLSHKQVLTGEPPRRTKRAELTFGRGQAARPASTA
jgi:hypothetical protein